MPWRAQDFVERPLRWWVGRPQLKRDPLGRSGESFLSDRLRRIIGWWQIACGLLGIGMFGAIFFDLIPYSRAWLENVGWINYYGGIGFFSLVVAAGRALLRNRDWGVRASFLCQAVQVLSFALLHGPHLQIAAGPTLSVRVTDSTINFTAGFNSTFFLGTRVSGPAFEVTLNLLAAVWAIALLRELTRRRHVVPSAAA